MIKKPIINIYYLIFKEKLFKKNLDNFKKLFLIYIIYQYYLQLL